MTDPPVPERISPGLRPLGIALSLIAAALLMTAAISKAWLHNPSGVGFGPMGCNDCGGPCRGITVVMRDRDNEKIPSARCLDSDESLSNSEFVDRLRAIRGDAARPHDAELADLATTLLAALQGGLLLAQTMRSTRPLELALDAAIDRVAARLPSSRRARPGSRRAGSPKQPRRSSPGA